jgi:hypothetical protein
MGIWWPLKEHESTFGSAEGAGAKVLTLAEALGEAEPESDDEEALAEGVIMPLMNDYPAPIGHVYIYRDRATEAKDTVTAGTSETHSDSHLKAMRQASMKALNKHDTTALASGTVKKDGKMERIKHEQETAEQRAKRRKVAAAKRELARAEDSDGNDMDWTAGLFAGAGAADTETDEDSSDEHGSKKKKKKVAKKKKEKTPKIVPKEEKQEPKDKENKDKKDKKQKLGDGSRPDWQVRQDQRRKKQSIESVIVSARQMVATFNENPTEINLGKLDKKIADAEKVGSPEDIGATFCGPTQDEGVDLLGLTFSAKEALECIQAVIRCFNATEDDKDELMRMSYNCSVFAMRVTKANSFSASWALDASSASTPVKLSVHDDIILEACKRMTAFAVATANWELWMAVCNPDDTSTDSADDVITVKDIKNGDKQKEAQFELLLLTLTGLFKDEVSSDLAIAFLHFITARVGDLKLLSKDVADSLRAVQTMYKWDLESKVHGESFRPEKGLLEQVERARVELKKTGKIARQFCNGGHSRTIVKSLERYQTEREVVSKTQEKLKAVIDTIRMGTRMRTLQFVVKKLTIFFRFHLSGFKQQDSDLQNSPNSCLPTWGPSS